MRRLVETEHYRFGCILYFPFFCNTVVFFVSLLVYCYKLHNLPRAYWLNKPSVNTPDRSDSTSAPDFEVFPLDEHNAKLLDCVHPKEWIDPDPPGVYNMVVIGAGAGGLVTAAGSSGVGARVAIIERHLLGGDCLNVGCVPSKV